MHKKKKCLHFSMYDIFLSFKPTEQTNNTTDFGIQQEKWSLRYFGVLISKNILVTIFLNILKINIQETIVAC